MTVRVIRDNMPLLIRAVMAVSRDEVLVGIPARNDARNDGQSNVALAYIHETGAPAQNIPARPTLEPGLQDARDPMVAAMRQALGQAFRDAVSLNATATGNSAVRDGLEHVGQIGAEAVRRRYGSSSLAPLAPSTLRKRRSRGNTSTAPLIDTRQLRDAVDYEVRPKRR